MKVPRSWEQAGLNSRKAMTFVIIVGISSGMGVSLLIGSGLLKESVPVTMFFGGAIGLAASYIVATAPKRMVTLAVFRQTLEAPSLAAAANIYLEATASRSKTFLMLDGDEPHLKEFLGKVRTKILLGYDAEMAVKGSSPDIHVFSESVKTVIGATVGVDRTRMEEGNDEMDGLVTASALSDETKMPIIIAVSFFLPIMLILATALSKTPNILMIVALVVLEIVILDITLAISRSSTSWKTKDSGAA